MDSSIPVIAILLLATILLVIVFKIKKMMHPAKTKKPVRKVRVTPGPIPDKMIDDPIICTLCPYEEDENGEPIPTVRLPDWEGYAQHILERHSDDTVRVAWATDALNDKKRAEEAKVEAERLNKERLALEAKARINRAQGASNRPTQKVVRTKDGKFAPPIPTVSVAAAVTAPPAVPSTAPAVIKQKMTLGRWLKKIFIDPI